MIAVAFLAGFAFAILVMISMAAGFVGDIDGR